MLVDLCFLLDTPEISLNFDFQFKILNALKYIDFERYIQYFNLNIISSIIHKHINNFYFENILFIIINIVIKKINLVVGFILLNILGIIDII